MADPNWRDGDYYYADSPAAGLAVARMAAHITYLSEAGGTDLYPQEAVGRLGPVRRGQGQGHPRRARLGLPVLRRDQGQQRAARIHPVGGKGLPRDRRDGVAERLPDHRFRGPPRRW